MTQASSRPPNRLIGEKSPYLLQHAFNPVDWYPWGAEAFEKARREDKPIFLSVGYSTCHWCHVMERESFENEEIAAILNARFVPVKVDREERPDVDATYMAFVQATTGGGGWPMSVWLTPDLLPFFGGTYFPPEDRWGRPGFKTVLLRIAEAWEEARPRIARAAATTAARLRDLLSTPAQPGGAPAPAVLDRAFRQFRAAYDLRHGGFGGAPKFPQPAVLDFLLRYYARTGAREALQMVVHTLQAMAAGGIHDHLGGGFHRYAVDERWRVPHFEKMLYDQAQLACVYLAAWQITREDLHAETAQGILNYVLREMTGPEGAFFSAEDADSPRPERPEESGEGAFYVWTLAEVIEILGQDLADIFCFYYGIEPDGNVRDDPHGEFHRKNILFAAHSLAETAGRFGRPETDIRTMLAAARAQLMERRRRRPRPLRDDKVLTAWNGLMISAFARAFQAWETPRYLQAAQRAADFIRTHLYEPKSATLQRRYRDGEAAVEAFAEDYAFLIQGLLDLYEASFDVASLDWAIMLQDRQNALFWDDANGGFFRTPVHAPAPIGRVKDAYDGAEPSASSISVLNLLRLALLADRPEYREKAERTLAAFSESLAQAPHMLPAMLAGLDFQTGNLLQLTITGSPAAADTRALLRDLRRPYLPTRILQRTDGRSRPAFPAPSKPIKGRAAVYLCENGVCRPPISDPEQWRAVLRTCFPHRPDLTRPDDPATPMADVLPMD